MTIRADRVAARYPEHWPAMPATAQWEAELRSGVAGQDRAFPGTWVSDALWRAACYEAEARDQFRLSDLDERAGRPVGADVAWSAGWDAMRRAEATLASVLRVVAGAAS